MRGIGRRLANVEKDHEAAAGGYSLPAESS